MSYTLVVFDWDGTLMDSAARIVSCFQAAAREVGLPIPDPERARGIIGLGLREAFVRLFPRAGEPELDRLSEAYRDQFLHRDGTASALFPGVARGLGQLKSESFLLAIATGKARRGLDRALRETGLDGLFSASRCVDEAVSKPHPRMLLDILAETGTEPGQAGMVGDTTFDMTMASAAGVDGLAVSYGAHPIDALLALRPKACLDDFEAVVRWLCDN